MLSLKLRQDNAEDPLMKRMKDIDATVWDKLQNLGIRKYLYSLLRDLLYEGWGLRSATYKFFQAPTTTSIDIRFVKSAI